MARVLFFRLRGDRKRRPECGKGTPDEEQPVEVTGEVDEATWLTGTFEGHDLPWLRNNPDLVPPDVQ